MMAQEENYSKSVTDAYNLMLHYKDYTGQTHQNCTVSADTTHMSFNQNEEGEDVVEGTQRDLKDVLCYR